MRSIPLERFHPFRGARSITAFALRAFSLKQTGLESAWISL